MPALHKIAAAITILACLTGPARAMAICNVSGLGIELETFSTITCDGALDHRQAVDCVNRLADEADQKERRASAAIAQAECLCNAMNDIIGGSGRYDRLSGTCEVSE